MPIPLCGPRGRQQRGICRSVGRPHDDFNFGNCRNLHLNFALVSHALTLHLFPLPPYTKWQNKSQVTNNHKLFDLEVVHKNPDGAVGIFRWIIDWFRNFSRLNSAHVPLLSYVCHFIHTCTLAHRHADTHICSDRLCQIDFSKESLDEHTWTPTRSVNICRCIFVWLCVCVWVCMCVFGWWVQGELKCPRSKMSKDSLGASICQKLSSHICECMRVMGGVCVRPRILLKHRWAITCLGISVCVCVSVCMCVISVYGEVKCPRSKASKEFLSASLCQSPSGRICAYRHSHTDTQICPDRFWQMDVSKEPLGTKVNTPPTQTHTHRSAPTDFNRAILQENTWTPELKKGTYHTHIHTCTLTQTHKQTLICSDRLWQIDV